MEQDLDSIRQIISRNEIGTSVANQDEHHRKIGFQDELRALLRKHEIEWDEKHVWD